MNIIDNIDDTLESILDGDIEDWAIASIIMGL